MILANGKSISSDLGILYPAPEISNPNLNFKLHWREILLLAPQNYFLLAPTWISLGIEDSQRFFWSIPLFFSLLEFSRVILSWVTTCIHQLPQTWFYWDSQGVMEVYAIIPYLKRVYVTLCLSHYHMLFFSGFSVWIIDRVNKEFLSSSISFFGGYYSSLYATITVPLCVWSRVEYVMLQTDRWYFVEKCISRLHR